MNDANIREAPPKFRILALDGGGIRGIFTASCLSTLEELSHAPVALYFDLLTGTSTGGIIALALAFGIPARRILQLYLEKGEKIFGRPRSVSMLFRPKHNNVELSKELIKFFGNRRLNDVATPVCIPTYELTSSYPKIWKDDHAVDLSVGGDKPAWKIALATCAAPMFFPAAQVVAGDCHVDGGMFANNPTLVGLTEAVKYFRHSIDNIEVLSIGTGEHSERVPFDKARRMGVWQWKTLAYEHMLMAQSRVTQEIARSLLPPANLVRLNLQLEHSYKLDDYRAAQGLIEPGAQVARLQFIHLRDQFFSLPAIVGRTQAALVKAQRIRNGEPESVPRL